MLAKIVARFREYCAKYDAATRGKRRLAVLVGGGSFNPLTRMHLRTYFLAKQCLEAKYGYVVLGRYAVSSGGCGGGVRWLRGFFSDGAGFSLVAVVGASVFGKDDH